MPFIKDGYSPVDQTISEGALGSYRWVQVIGFLALAAGSLCVAGLVYSVRGASAGMAITAAVIAFSTVFTITLAIIPADGPAETTVGGRIHVAAAALAFIIAIAGILLASRTFRGHPVLAPLASASRIIGIASLALLVVAGAGIEPAGVWQRATVGGELAWFIVVAGRLGVTSKRTDAIA